MKEPIKQFIEIKSQIALDQQGFNGIRDFMESVFHISKFKLILASTGIMTSLAAFSEQYIGVKPIVLFAILILFVFEMATGIWSARKNVEFNTKRSPRGFVKMFVYLVMIGTSNIFAKHLGTVMIPYTDVSLNFYLVIHYAFLNFTIINLFISNIENFEKLGWNEYVPLLKKLHSVLRLKKTKTNKEDEQN